MGKRVSFAEYARHRGVSRAAVTNAVKDRRITPTMDPKTGKWWVDTDVADREWAQNTRHDMRLNGLGNYSRDEAETQKRAPAPEPERAPDPAPEPQQAPERAPAPAQPPLEYTPPPAPIEDKQGPTVANARAIKEAFQARLAKLDYEERIKKLVDADQVKTRWLEIATIIRTKVLGLPSKAKQRCPDLTTDQYTELELIAREILEELATGRML